MNQQQIHIIQSEALGERILLVHGDINLRNAAELYPECVPYTDAEVDRLSGLSEETLKLVHGVKKHFRGSVSRVSAPVL